jgi:uroporphyrinogen decarboxylase
MPGNEMNHKERVESVLNGVKTDRPVVSAWRHFYDRENSKEDLVDAMIEFQRKFDWDFVKINSRASYHVEDWGVRFRFSDNPLAKPVAESFPVEHREDWKKIKSLDHSKGSLGEILEAGKGILKRIGREVFCIPTVFSPLSIAADLVDSEQRFQSQMKEGPDELHQALNAISETFEAYVKELIGAGMAGIFFATTEWASRDRITEDEYLEFGRPYDLRVLRAADDGFFNVVHVCKTNNMLPLFRDYPAPVISWNPFEAGNLSVHQAAQIIDKVFLTGIDQNNALLNGSREEIREQVEASLKDAPVGKLMVAPGCAVKVNTPDDNLIAFGDAARGWRP